MDVGNLILASLLIFFYFYFFDLQYYSKSNSIGPDPTTIWGAIFDKRFYNLSYGDVKDIGVFVSKISAICWTIVVMLPALYYYFLEKSDWILHSLGYIGLTFLLGPAAIRDASSIRPSFKARSLVSKVRHWLYRKIFYGLSDKINVLTKIAILGLLIWVVRKLFDWPAAINSYIPHAPWFPEQIGLERSNIISDAVWVSMFLILGIKTITSPIHMISAHVDDPSSQSPNLEGFYYLISRGIVALLTIHFIASYTAFIGADANGFNIAALFSIIVNRH